LDSVNGPSITVRRPPRKSRRVLRELGCSPSAASSTPASTISPISFGISAISSSLGGAPASMLLSALCIIM
jgi:hypothetical protein